MVSVFIFSFSAMNPTIKKILLYFAVAWAVIISVLGITAIWWNINEDIIWRTLLTYLVLFLAILAISATPSLYDKFKNYTEIASIGSWILIISIAIVWLLICMDIWKAFLQSDLIRKIIATIGILNCSVLMAVFSIDKRGSKSS